MQVFFLLDDSNIGIGTRYLKEHPGESPKDLMLSPDFRGIERSPKFSGLMSSS